MLLLEKNDVLLVLFELNEEYTFYCWRNEENVHLVVECYGKKQGKFLAFASNST